jgi:hypothetical protein
MGTHVHKNKLKLLRSESGKITIVTIVIILVVAAAVYFAIMLAPPYIEHYKFEEKLRAVANTAHRVKKEEILRADIDRELKNLDMELPYDAIQIRFDPMGEWVEFSAAYARVVELVPFGSKVTLHFDSLVVERFD